MSTVVPSGWKTARDPDTGDTYYYHVKTKEVSWDPPTNAQQRQLQQLQQPSEEAGAPPKPSPRASSAALSSRDVVSRGKLLLRSSLSGVFDSMQGEGDAAAPSLPAASATTSAGDSPARRAPHPYSLAAVREQTSSRASPLRTSADAGAGAGAGAANTSSDEEEDDEDEDDADEDDDDRENRSGDDEAGPSTTTAASGRASTATRTPGGAAGPRGAQPASAPSTTASASASASAARALAADGKARLRRRLTYLGGKNVKPQRAPPLLVDDALVVPPVEETHKEQGFVDLCWYRGAGKSARETGFYAGAGLAHPVVRFLNATRTLKPAAFQLLSGYSDAPCAELAGNRVIKARVFKLSVGAQTLYTLKRKGASKIHVFEGDTLEYDYVRYVVQFGPDRVCVKRRDETSLGIALGSTLVDWRPDPNPDALLDRVRIGSGFDVVLCMSCLGLADYLFEYRALAASADAKRAVAEAAAFAGGTGARVDLRKVLCGKTSPALIE